MALSIVLFTFLGFVIYHTMFKNPTYLKEAESDLNTRDDSDIEIDDNVIAALSSERLGKEALTCYINIMHQWAVTDTHTILQLVQISEETYVDWKGGKDIKLSYESLMCISYIIRINRCLSRINCQGSQGHEWLQSPNPSLGGKSPVHYILSGSLQRYKEVAENLETTVALDI